MASCAPGRHRGRDPGHLRGKALLDHDLPIDGGINGAGIARGAARRGLHLSAAEVARAAHRMRARRTEAALG